MIKFFYLSGVLLLNGGFGDTDSSKTAAQRIEYHAENSLVYDFGTITQDIPASRIFKIYNNTNKEVRIRTIWPSIYGTVTAWTKKPIKPGKAALMKVIYNAAKPGPFEMNLKVVYYNHEALRGEPLVEDIIVKGITD